MLSTAPVADPLTAKIILAEAYDETYGICDHSKTTESDVLKIVAHHPVEDYSKVSARYHYMRRYRESNILKVFGVNYLDFLKLPLDEVEELLRQATESVLADNQRAAAVESKLEAQLSTPKN